MTRCQWPQCVDHGKFVCNLVIIFLLAISHKLSNNLFRFKNLFVARNISVQAHQLDFNRWVLVYRSILKVIVEVAHVLEKSVRVNLRKWPGRRMEKCFNYYSVTRR